MMKMNDEYKICASCGRKVDIETNFCPSCKSQTFTSQPSRVEKNPPAGIAQTLLYWSYDGNFVLAKSKVAGIIVFLFFVLAAFNYEFGAGMFILALISAIFTFLVGYLIHYFKGKPSDAVVKNNNNGVFTDLFNLFFYWQNRKTGEFVPSKTKIISFVMFILFTMLCAITASNPTLFASLAVGFIFSVPVFIVGFVIHKITNPNPINPKMVETKTPPKMPKREEKTIDEAYKKAEIEEPKVIAKFQSYENRVNELADEYNAKEKVARDLIEKRFAPPQITYTRFITMVDKAGVIFKKESESALNILHLASDDSPRIDREIDAKIKIMEAIIDKIEDLTNELVLSMDSSKDTDVDTLIEDMGDLISSVKDYNE